MRTSLRNPFHQSTLGPGIALSATFDQPVQLASDFSLTLTDGHDVGQLTRQDAFAWESNSGRTVNWFVFARPDMTTGSSLGLTNVEVLDQSGISDSVGPWNLALSGAVVSAGSTSGSTYSRVFGGTNSAITSPLAPEIYDVIPVATNDLPDAPEVITACSTGATERIYDEATGKLLGQDPCGTFPADLPSTDTRGPGLDYIPTPGLTSFETVIATQVLPGSTYEYESSPGFPPQIKSISASGHTLTLTYGQPVTCDASAAGTVSQFKYAPSASSTTLVYPTSVSCPGAAGGATITVTFSSPLPAGTIRFKYEGYGPGAFVTAGTSSPDSGTRAPSQSALVTVP